MHDLDPLLRRTQAQQQQAFELAKFRVETARVLEAPLLAEEYARALDQNPGAENFPVATGRPLSIALQATDQLLMAVGLIRPQQANGEAN